LTQSSSGPEDPIRVLHVDDEQDQLNFTRAFLVNSDPSLQLESALTPERALARLAEGEYDCIVSDYQMPGFDGIELARRIRETSDVPIIIYTGQGSEEVAEAAFTVGVDDYLRKELSPSHYQVLAKRIRTAVEGRRVEAERRESEERYRTLVESTPNAISVTVDGEILYVNQKRVELTGHADKSELVGTSGLVHVAPPDRELIESTIQARAMGERIPPIQEFRLTKTDGSVVVVVDHTTEVDWDGRRALMHLLQDVTEQRRMEEELQKSEQEKRLILESSPDAIVVNDDKAFLYLNRVATKMFGFDDPADLIGRAFADFFPQEYRRASRRYDSQIRRADGSLVDVEFNIETIIYEGNLAILNIIRDITERKRLEDELIMREQRYRTLFELAPDGIMTLDLKGTITSINSAYIRLTGYSRDEIVGKHFTKISTITARDIGKYVKMFASFMMETLPHRTVEFDYRRKDGSIGRGESHAQLVELESGKKEILAILRDISDRTRIERELREGEARLRSFMDSVTDRIHIYDSELRLLDFNEAASRFAGLTETDLGKHILELSPTLEGSSRYKEYLNVIKTGTPFILEHSFPRSDREVRQFSISAFKVNDGLGLFLTDITEQRKVEERIRFLGQVLETSPISVIATGEGGDILYVNPATERMFGYEKGGLVGKNPRILNADPDADNIQREIFETVLRGEIWRGEILNRRKNGETFYIHASIYQLTDESGNLIALVGFQEDISERKRMEEALESSEERFRRLFQQSNDAVFIHNFTGEILDVNEKSCEMLGYSRKELLSIPVPGLHPEESIPDSQEAFAATVGTGSVRFESMFRKADGTIIDVDISSRVIDRENEIIQGIVRDISERKRMEEALRRIVDEKEAILGAISDSISLKGTDYRFIWVNKALADSLPLPTDEVIGKICYEIIYGRDEPCEICPVRKALETGQRVRETITFLSGDIFDSVVEPIYDTSGDIIAFVELSRDITERKRMEDENALYQSRLEALNKHAIEINEARSLDEIAEATLDAVETVLGFQWIALGIVEDTRLRFVSTRGLTSIQEMSLDGPGITVRAVKTGEPQLVQDTRIDNDYVTGRANGSHESMSELSVPVIVEGEAVAVINVESEELNAFNQNDVMLVETLAQHVASAYHRLKQIEALEASEQRLRILFENVPDAIFLGDFAGNIVDGNKTAETMLGYSRDELIGKNMLDVDILASDQVPKFVESMARSAEGHPTGPDEFIVNRRDGERFTVEVSTFPITIEDEPLALGIARDITERKMMEGELRNSLIRFQTLFRHVPESVLLLDPGDYSIISANNVAMEQAGLKEDEIVGKPCFDVLHNISSPCETNDNICPLEEMHESGESVTVVHFHYDDDGNPRFEEVTVNPVRDDNGIIKQVVHIARDITEQKKMVEELRKSRDILDSFMESATDGFSLFDSELDLIDINYAALNRFGASKGDVVGKNILELRPDAGESGLHERYLEVMRTGEPYIDEFEIEHHRLGKRFLTLKAFRIEDGLGVITTDITESRLIEEELRRHSEALEELAEKRAQELVDSERRYRSLFETSREGIIISGPDGNIISANPALAQMLGYERPEDLIGKPAADFYSDKSRRPEIFEALMRDGFVDGWELTFRKTDGTPVHVFGSGTLHRDEDGNILRAAGIFTDITDRKTMEQEIEATNRELLDAERMAAAGRVSAMMGHDLRGPLQTINNSLYLLKKTPEKRDELLETMEEAVVYAEKMLENLRLSTGDPSLEIVEGNLGAVVSRAISDISIPESVEVELEVEEGLPDIPFDPMRIRRVVDNLVRNSLEAMPEGGRLTIKISKDGEAVAVEVRDTGIGIPPEDIDKVFKPFFTTKAGGMGLGLPFCKRTVEAHGGALDVESSPGEGTTMTIRLPATRGNHVDEDEQRSAA